MPAKNKRRETSVALSHRKRQPASMNVAIRDALDWFRAHQML